PSVPPSNPANGVVRRRREQVCLTTARPTPTGVLLPPPVGEVAQDAQADCDGEGNRQARLKGALHKPYDPYNSAPPFRPLESTGGGVHFVEIVRFETGAAFIRANRCRRRPDVPVVRQCQAMPSRSFRRGASCFRSAAASWPVAGPSPHSWRQASTMPMPPVCQRPPPSSSLWRMVTTRGSAS